MKKSLLTFLAAAVVTVVLSGCVRTVDGNVKAGVPFRKDTIVSRYERTVAQVFATAKQTIADNGVVVGENTVNNSLIGKVDTKTVYMRVREVDQVISEIQVQVRTQGGGADIDLAAELDKQVAIKLVR